MDAGDAAGRDALQPLPEGAPSGLKHETHKDTDNFLVTV
jgi:hypothetical protein